MGTWTLVLAVAVGLSTTAPTLAQPSMTPPPPPIPVDNCALPAPAPPQSLRPHKTRDRPQKPPCAASNRCRAKDVEGYNAAIQDYNAQVNAWNNASERYVDALNAGQRSVEVYSRCEIDSMNAEIPR